MPPSKPVNITSSSQWSGNFDCSGPCRRKRLVGDEFSKKAIERYRREGKALKCKQCVASAEAAERQAAQDRAKAKASSQAAGGGGGSGSDDAKNKDGASQPPVTCAACSKSLPTNSYNRNQLSKPPGKARCRSCVEEAVAKEAEMVKSSRQERVQKAQKDLEDARRRGDTKGIIAAESVVAAMEAEVVTGLKPVVLGKGRGRGGRWSSGRGRATAGSGRGRGRGGR